MPAISGRREGLVHAFQVNFRDSGSGETSATITCDNPDGTQDTTAATGWETSDTETGVSAPVVVTCTITIDP